MLNKETFMSSIDEKLLNITKDYIDTGSSTYMNQFHSELGKIDRKDFIDVLQRYVQYLYDHGGSLAKDRFNQYDKKKYYRMDEIRDLARELQEKEMAIQYNEEQQPVAKKNPDAYKFSYCKRQPWEVWKDEGFSEFLTHLQHGQIKFWFALVLFIVSLIVLIGGMVVFGGWFLNNPLYGLLTFGGLLLFLIGAGFVLKHYSEMKWEKTEKMSVYYCKNIKYSPTDQGDYADFKE